MPHTGGYWQLLLLKWSANAAVTRKEDTVYPQNSDRWLSVHGSGLHEQQLWRMSPCLNDVLCVLCGHPLLPCTASRNPVQPSGLGLLKPLITSYLLAIVTESEIGIRASLVTKAQGATGWALLERQPPYSPLGSTWRDAHFFWT